MSIYKFRQVSLAADKFQALTGAQSKFSKKIEHTITLDVSDPVHAAEVQRLMADIEQELVESKVVHLSKLPFNTQENTLKLQWGEARHSGIIFREKAGDSFVELKPDQLPKLFPGSVVSVGVEPWLREYDKNGEKGCSVTLYPNVVVINSVAQGERKSGPSKAQSETLAYLIGDDTNTSGDF